LSAKLQFVLYESTNDPPNFETTLLNSNITVALN